MVFPHDNHILKLPQSKITAALAKVESLDGDMEREAKDTSSSPSLELLEAYRVRGQAIRNELGMGARTEANAAFSRAATLEGQEKEDAYEEVMHFFTIASSCADYTATMHCNIAAVALLQEELVAQRTPKRAPLTLFEQLRAGRVERRRSAQGTDSPDALTRRVRRAPRLRAAQVRNGQGAKRAFGRPGARVAGRTGAHTQGAHVESYIAARTWLCGPMRAAPQEPDVL